MRKRRRRRRILTTRYTVGFARHIKRIKIVSLHLYYSRAICYQIQSTMVKVTSSAYRPKVPNFRVVYMLQTFLRIAIKKYAQVVPCKKQET